MGVADRPSPGVASRRIAEASKRADPWLASAAAPAAGASAAPAERLIVIVIGLLQLSPSPFELKRITWSDEGQPRRESERSNVGRGKVADEGEEEEDEEVEAAVVDRGAAIVVAEEEFLDPIRAAPPSAPGIDAHDDAATRTWR